MNYLHLKRLISNNLEPKTELRDLIKTQTIHFYHHLISTKEQNLCTKHRSCSMRFNQGITHSSIQIPRRKFIWNLKSLCFNYVIKKRNFMLFLKLVVNMMICINITILYVCQKDKWYRLPIEKTIRYISQQMANLKTKNFKESKMIFINQEISQLLWNHRIPKTKKTKQTMISI